MRIAIMGNSGSGKSTFAKHLHQKHNLEILELDNIVWEAGKIAVLRAEAEILADLHNFLKQHQDWVIEGCYGELVAKALPYCSELIFLNPGEAICLANNRQRPWEPHKYQSAAAQEAMLAGLLEWVSGYYHRDDQWSLAYHRQLFDSFPGNKCELVDWTKEESYF